MFWFWVTCGVKIMWLCHDWCWQPPQIASHIHIRYVQCAWAHWYAIYGHTVSALHSYTHPTFKLRFWSSGSLVESKWCDYVMVEADSHLKLLPTSIWEIYKVFELIDMLSIGIWLQPNTYPPYLIQILGFWVTCGVKMMSLHQGWCWQPPQTASNLHLRHCKVFEYINLSIGIW